MQNFNQHQKLPQIPAYAGLFLKRNLRRILCGILLIAFALSLFIPSCRKASKAASPLIILSKYSLSMNIGEEYLLKAVTSDFSFPKYKSSKSSIASVDAYGLITAKKEGSCKIRVKSGSSEVYCQIQVKKTTITLNRTKLSLEHGETFSLKAVTSNGHRPAFKCSKKSVALISENGAITALKPGEAVITVKADTTESHCTLTVKKPVITLNRTRISLYRNQSFQLTAAVSSGIQPVWKSNKKSVASVDENGAVHALKHGTATITATVDGVKKNCMVTVKSPSILLNRTSVTLKTGEQFTLTARVSSGIPPVWSSSKSSVATVDEAGRITAEKKGTALIRAKEDGATAECIVLVQ
ncbi:MAG: Ig-like domain-containing protein [Lachnospiraceae bacterium]|nr:Ig-like domain-containing protein [Lachnospiraceae bacterium]